MSLGQKIGQLLIFGIEGTTTDARAAYLIKDKGIGGLNLLKRNVQNSGQVKKLTSDLQQISRIPLFIAADQEGGDVVRFKFLKELTPESRMTSVAQAKAVGFARAKELANLGVNMIFSPVLDHVTDPNAYLYSRTFESDPGTTGKLGLALIQGYYQGGILPVAKHFPGYGNISPDPHKNVAILDIGKKEFQDDLIPFAMVAKDSSTVGMMTAHIIIPEISELPATYSSDVLDILRKDMGFQGLVITDDLEMVSAGSSTAEVAVRAIKAGADMLIDTYTPARQDQIMNALAEAVAKGDISEERIDRSVTRILKAKSLLGT